MRYFANITLHKTVKFNKSKIFGSDVKFVHVIAGNIDNIVY